MIYAAEELMCLGVAPLMCVGGRANGIGPSFGAITTDRTKATISSSRFSSQRQKNHQLSEVVKDKQPLVLS